ncbi:universal stress protein [Saliphagus sp. GCM10025317]
MSRHLLVAMDDSEPARAALEYALSAFPESSITVVHVVDDLEAGYGGGPTAEAARDQDEPAFFPDARRLAEGHAGDVALEVLEGTPVDAILEYVRSNDVDGVVVGSEGRSGVSRMLLGSVAEGVARRVEVPVTIV